MPHHRQPGAHHFREQVVDGDPAALFLFFYRSFSSSATIATLIAGKKRTYRNDCSPVYTIKNYNNKTFFKHIKSILSFYKF